MEGEEIEGEEEEESEGAEAPAWPVVSIPPPSYPTSVLIPSVLLSPPSPHTLTPFLGCYMLWSLAKKNRQLFKLIFAELSAAGNRRFFTRFGRGH